MLRSCWSVCLQRHLLHDQQLLRYASGLCASLFHHCASLLAPLRSDTPVTRCAFPTHAQAISQVAGIEFRVDQWKDLMPVLLSSCMNPAAPPHAKHAMLLTIGYICEEIVRPPDRPSVPVLPLTAPVC